MDRNQIELPPQELKSRLDAGTPPILIDVRGTQEWGINRLPGAVHIPLDRLGEVLDQYGADDELVLYCHHGVRSMNAAMFLREKGFTNTRSLAGGIDLWSLRIDPAVPRY